MGIKNSFKSWLKTRDQKASQSSPLLVRFGGAGQAQFTPRQYDRLAEEGYQKNVIAYRCIRLIAQNAASVPWVLFEGRGPLRRKLHEHPLLSLLSNPNPAQGGTELLESLFGFFLIAGNSYIEAVGPDGAKPHELWALRPDRLRIVPGKGGMVESYRYSVAGQTLDFPVSHLTGRARVLHIKSFHPLDDWYGMSPLEAAAFSIDQHNAAAKWNASLLQQSGRPSGALVFKPTANGPDQLSEEQRLELKNELESFFSGSHNAGRPMVLEGGLDWKEMALSPKDMDWLAGKDLSAREIALAYNVPPQLIGLEGSLTFANFEQARLAFYDDAVLPLLCHFRDELNNWLAPEFGDDLTLDFDRDAIEALSARRDKMWERITSADFLTVNEKRAALGLERIDGGDALLPSLRE